MELTMPSLLKENYEKWGDKVWMRKKELGFWREYTWKDGYEKVKHFSLGLISLGFQWGDHMAIVGDNDPHWFWAELAAQCAGGAVTGPFSSSLPNELKYYVEHSDSKFVVVQDQEQVDKMLQVKDELPLVKKVIYWDPAGMRYYDDPLLMSFDDVSRLGQEYEATHPGLFEQNIERVKGEDTALIQYTSGTTGLPKGAVTTYANLFSQNEIFYSMNPMDERDEWLSFILPGWMAEQGLGLLGSMNRGLRLSFPEQLATVPENIREIGPTVLFYASRLWEGTASTIQNRIMESTWLKRALYHFCLPIGYRAADAKFKGERLNLFWGALYGLAKLALFNPLKDKLGFSRIRYAFTAGALLGPEIFRFITAMGLDLRQMYGSSESPGGTQHTVDDIKVDSVGRVNPQTLIRICDDNHILLAGPSGSRGYYKNPEASAKTWAAGWYHTGDAGHLPGRRDGGGDQPRRSGAEDGDRRGGGERHLGTGGQGPEYADRQPKRAARNRDEGRSNRKRRREGIRGRGAGGRLEGPGGQDEGGAATRDRVEQQAVSDQAADAGGFGQPAERESGERSGRERAGGCCTQPQRLSASGVALVECGGCAEGRGDRGGDEGVRAADQWLYQLGIQE